MEMSDDTTMTQDPTLERDAFMTRVEGILDPAYRLATVILLDHAVAEDAVHGATLRAWSRYRAMGGEVINFRTWFLALVAEHCLRLRRWRLLTLRGSGPGHVGGPGDIVGELPLASRTALFCRVSLGLPDDEAARVLRTSPVRVRNRAFRARERVEAELQRREEEEEEEE
jgi:DNA-directed RNA polymerase specialized sigma24 family protein